ncbi:MAG: magnesium transporter [Gemmatimonadetes bacterium]|nr:MAG: magnesium transporter [Gemmatimonadota bacterium]
MSKTTRLRIQALKDLVTAGVDEELLDDQLKDLHASDIADLIEHLEDDQRLLLMRRLPPDVAADALAEMEEVERPADLLLQLELRRIGEIVGEMADDDAADILGELEPEQQAEVLSVVAVPDAVHIEELLHHAEDTAGGIMTRDMLAIRSNLTAGEAIAEIRRQARGDMEFYTIFVIESDRRLIGVVSLHDLVLSEPGVALSAIIEQPRAVVPVDMDQEEVSHILSRYNLASIGVVDESGRLLGRVTFDDVIDVLEAEMTEDILRFAAVSDEEHVRGSTVDAIRSRLPWLLLNLGTASLGALVVWNFRDTIENLVVLAVVMPIVAGLGGNAGTQALAVTIRRIALADESLAERWHVLGKEALVGLLNGLAVGALAFALGYVLLGQGPVFGLVVLLAMWGNLVVASFAGAFIPIVLESAGIDPAVASSVFVTALTDLTGFLLLLGLATAVLT